MKSEGASSPVERALWFIENRLGGEISLESIAKSVGVTAFSDRLSMLQVIRSQSVNTDIAVTYRKAY